jgi:glycosyltransferase involved in cell wall biosynthesis
MKFSVVTISYNQVEFLEAAIRSVIGQAGLEVEYIMVDPGSTDGSRAVIEKYSGSFAHILLDKDQGPADGLNQGFAKATGDVYCYLNADDTFEPGGLQRAAAFLHEHPELDVICGHAFITDRQDSRLRRVWSEPYSRLMVAYNAAVQIQPSTFIRRSAFIKSGGFNLNNRSSWDAELLMELFLSGARIGIIDEFLSTYRLHSESLTNSGRMLAALKKFSERRFERLMGRPRDASDNIVERVLRIVKHLQRPIATWERVVRGPIFGRGVH